MPIKKRLVQGVGINDANYVVRPTINGKTILCFFYQTWGNMLKRCYSSKFQNECKTYIGCTVDKRWHKFTEFRNWMELQNWHDNDLDKDILFPGNKIYSPETCIFIPHSLNSLLTDSAASRGKYPQGVTWNKQAKKYVAQININGKAVHIGYFKNIEDAEKAYKNVKAKIIMTVAARQIDNRLKLALNKHAKLYLNGV